MTHTTYETDASRLAMVCRDLLARHRLPEEVHDLLRALSWYSCGVCRRPAGPDEAAVEFDGVPCHPRCVAVCGDCRGMWTDEEVTGGLCPDCRWERGADMHEAMHGPEVAS